MNVVAERGSKMSIRELEAAVMNLPPEERRSLGVKLLSSVDSRLKYEAEWADEVEERIRAVRDGAVEPIPGDDVIRAALERVM